MADICVPGGNSVKKSGGISRLMVQLESDRLKAIKCVAAVISCLQPNGVFPSQLSDAMLKPRARVSSGTETDSHHITGGGA